MWLAFRIALGARLGTAFANFLLRILSPLLVIFIVTLIVILTYFWMTYEPQTELTTETKTTEQVSRC